MVSVITNGIEITVDVHYQQDYSNPLSQEYMFAYRITIENHNKFSVQLLRRQWYIFDSNGEHREVEGEGVVGLLPIIFNGKPFTYMSGCNLKTEMGKMGGFYMMLAMNNNASFKITIPDFQMIAPHKLN